MDRFGIGRLSRENMLPRYASYAWVAQKKDEVGEAGKVGKAYEKQNAEKADEKKEEKYEEVGKAEEKMLAVFLQMHNLEQLDEWKEHLEILCTHLESFHVDLYLTVLKSDVVDQVRDHFSCLPCSVKTVDVFHNRGMDIGAFLWQLQRHLVTLKTIPYSGMFKFHTKSDKKWRLGMVQPFLSPELPEWIEYMKCQNMSWMGTRNYAWRSEYLESQLTRDLEKNVFGRISFPHERVFLAGSIFYMSWSLLMELVSHPSLRNSIQNCYQRTPIGRCEHALPHAFERFFAFYGNMKQMRYKLIK